MPTPTFFLVGAPKAGTTSLSRYLAQHPEVAVATEKEPCFFAPEVPVSASTDAHRRDWTSYLSLFAHATAARAIGEGSVAYLGSAHAPAAIAARIPNAKILMMLRDPANRLFAHYAAARASDATRLAFLDWVSEQRAAENGRTPTWGPIWAGRYATHLARYQQHFAPQQIHVSFFEDFIDTPDVVLASIFAFLGVDPTVTIDRRERHNVTTVARWPALSVVRRPVASILRRTLPVAALERARTWSRAPFSLTPSLTEHAAAIDIYRSEIDGLARLTGRDLSLWLTPSNVAG